MTKRTPEPDDSAEAETSRGAAGKDRPAKARATKAAPTVKAAAPPATKAVPASKAAAAKAGKGAISSGDDPGDSAAADKSVAEAALRELWESFKKTGEMA